MRLDARYQTKSQRPIDPSNLLTDDRPTPHPHWLANSPDEVQDLLISTIFNQVRNVLTDGRQHVDDLALLPPIPAEDRSALEAAFPELVENGKLKWTDDDLGNNSESNANATSSAAIHQSGTSSFIGHYTKHFTPAANFTWSSAKLGGRLGLSITKGVVKHSAKAAFHTGIKYFTTTMNIGMPKATQEYMEAMRARVATTREFLADVTTAPQQCNIRPSDPQLHESREREIPFEDINLDLPPHERWKKIIGKRKASVNKLIQDVIGLYPDLFRFLH